MSLPTITTILNNAPLIIQGANKLLQLIRNRNRSSEETELPDTLDGLRQELIRIHRRLDDNDDSNAQQIELIDQLARQNEMLANSLNNTMKRLRLISIIAIVLLVIAATSFIYVLM